VNTHDSKAEIFDVFMCHNSEDKADVREIAQKLSKENIKPWLDEEQIRPGTSWQTALGQQIESIESAAVFVGESGLGPWQNQEIQALLNQFVKRECPVIPVILPSVKTTPEMPWTLENLHCVDFRTDFQPLKRLIWGITGQKPAALSDVLSSEKPATMQEAAKSRLIPDNDEQAKSDKVISEARLYPPLAEEPDKEQKTQLEILAGRVVEYWVDGVLKHSLYNEVLISLGKREIGNAVDAPWKYTVEVSDATNSATLDDRNVSAIYDATSLLLILGEPGSGKTTTLLDLARTLLERARQDIKERVPIVVNLSSWKNRQPLAEWISGELSEKYRVPRKIARFWLKHDYLLPLLDGLDELETVMQPDCVTAINAFIEEFNPSGLVVCCRLNEYRWLPKRLKLNGAICLEPLSSEEVSKYLAEGGSILATLRKVVNTDPVLQELAQTPLMLSIMSLASQGAGADELAGQKGDSPDERRKQVFHLYVEKMLQRKGTTSLVFPKEKTIGWLSWLAGKMREHSQSILLVEGLQPSWLSTRVRFYRFVVGLVYVFSYGLMFVLLDKFSINELPLDGTLKLLLVTSLIGGAIAACDKSLPKPITLVEAFSWEWNQFWLPLPVGLILGAIVGLMFIPIVFVASLVGVASIQEVRVSLFFWPLMGLILGIFAGLFGVFSHRAIAEERKTFANQAIKLSLKNSLAALIIAFLIFGLSVGLFSGLIFGLSVGRTFGLSIGLVCGLIVGFFRGGSAVIKHYVLRLILWRSGYTPFNFIKFLDQCARLILLKKVGGGYIFVHRMLLEYFAEMTPSDHERAEDVKTRSVGP
jgi:hypothetical protein